MQSTKEQPQVLFERKYSGKNQIKVFLSIFLLFHLATALNSKLIEYLVTEQVDSSTNNHFGTILLLVTKKITYRCIYIYIENDTYVQQL